MIKNNIVYINHILDQISNIENFTRDISEEELRNNTEKEYAVIRCFEIIGEASKKIDTDFRNKYTNLPFHDYDRIVSEIIWNTLKKDIPGLKTSLIEIIKNEG